MKAEARGCVSRLRSPLPVALLFFSAAAMAPSQTTSSESPIQFETHYRTGTSGFGRVRAYWRAAPLADVHLEIEGARRAEAGVAFLHLHGERWSLDAGRQSFTLGDERLIGGNRERGVRERGWDGLRAQWSLSGVELHALAGQRGAQRLGGLAATVSVGERLTLEPYVLRSRTTQVQGVRAFGPGCNVEIASEGSGVWAGHWDVSAPLPGVDATLEFNYATPGFDELYPAMLNAHGTEDPFPWSDIRNVAFNAGRTLRAKLQVNGSYRSYWTASGEYLAQHAVAGLSYEARHWRLDAGCGRLLAVRSADAPRWTSFVALSYRF